MVLVEAGDVGRRSVRLVPHRHDLLACSTCASPPPQRKPADHVRSGSARSASRESRREAGWRTAGCRDDFQRDVPQPRGRHEDDERALPEGVRSALGVASTRRRLERRMALVRRKPRPVGEHRVRPLGASLAAVALTQTPDDYRTATTVREQSAALQAYLMDSIASRRLHDRLALLFARSFIPDSLRQSITADALGKQQADGGWTIDSLGPWMAHPDAPPSTGSNAYATAFTAVTLLRGGVPADDPKLARALDWLQSHQDASTGAWAAVSMNKRYPEGSMESRFMQDAATAFASLALIEAGR